MEAWTTQTTSVCTSKRRATTRSFTAYDQQGEEFQETIQALKENTYVDNLMKTGEEEQELKKFKIEATSILASARFPV